MHVCHACAPCMCAMRVCHVCVPCVCAACIMCERVYLARTRLRCSVLQCVAVCAATHLQESRAALLSLAMRVCHARVPCVCAMRVCCVRVLCVHCVYLVRAHVLCTQACLCLGVPVCYSTLQRVLRCVATLKPRRCRVLQRVAVRVYALGHHLTHIFSPSHLLRVFLAQKKNPSPQKKTSFSTPNASVTAHTSCSATSTCACLRLH